jgi:ribosomal protein S18 acetylase RimI-like enzyme
MVFMYSITVDYDPKEEDRKIIEAGLILTTKNVLGHKNFLEKSFSVLLKDGNNIRGGIVARYDSESVYIDLLWVDENSRNQGCGTRLLNTAENEARKLGCHYSTVDTYNFQASKFYLKNGYEWLGEIKNYYLNYSKIFFRKKIYKSLSRSIL